MNDEHEIDEDFEEEKDLDEVEQVAAMTCPHCGGEIHIIVATPTDDED